MWGLLSWLPVFKEGPYLWRLPGWASPTAGRFSGIRQLARPSAVTAPPPPPPRTGLGRWVGLRGLTESSSVPGCLWVPVGAGRGGMVVKGATANRKPQATVGDSQEAEKGTHICDRHCIWHFPKAHKSQLRLVSCAALDRRPSREHKDQGSCVGCYCPDLSLGYKVNRPKHPGPWKPPDPFQGKTKKVENPCLGGICRSFRFIRKGVKAQLTQGKLQRNKQE